MRNAARDQELQNLRRPDSETLTSAEAVQGGVVLRSIPYPYRAMLAICSDLDETPNRHVYLDIMRFLNTAEMTSMGPGVCLDVGNTIYFNMPPNQFSYWNTSDAGRDMIRTLIRSGHVDCLHSYGDRATTRADAGRALDELDRYGCELRIWIDHGRAPSNFGSDIMQGSGDVPGSPVYHADLTCGFGVEYVWRGRVTSAIGQDVPSTLAGIWTGRHPIASARTVAKEAVKHLAGQCGHRKYTMHGSNRVLRRSCLRDGRPVQEFLRSNPHWAGVNSCETGGAIGHVLTDAFLEHLIRRHGVCILYTHLGKVWQHHTPFDDLAVVAFRRLAGAYRDGRILVLTTERTLRYLTLKEHLAWTTHRKNRTLTIDVRTNGHTGSAPRTASSDAMAGITFYVPDGFQYRLNVNAREIEDLQVNAPDQTGRRSVMVPIRRLSFPDL